MLANGRNFIGRFEDLIRLLVYALAWGVLTQLHLRMGRGIVSLVAFVWCSLVALAWSWRVLPRLRDAGLPRWYLLPFVCTPMVLLGFLVQFKVIGGTLALVLFVLTQIPIAFLRRKPKPDEMAGAQPLTRC